MADTSRPFIIGIMTITIIEVSIHFNNINMFHCTQIDRQSAADKMTACFRAYLQKSRDFPCSRAALVGILTDSARGHARKQCSWACSQTVLAGVLADVFADMLADMFADSARGRARRHARGHVRGHARGHVCQSVRGHVRGHAREHVCGRNTVCRYTGLVRSTKRDQIGHEFD